MWNSTFEQVLGYWLTKDWSGLQIMVSITWVAELLCTQLFGLSKVGVLKAFLRDRRSSWLACVAKAFPCGFGAKNEEGESKTARKIGRVIASKPHRNACYADYSWLNGDFREYQNHPFLGTWFRFSLQFFRSSHQDNFENFWQVVLPV